MANIVLNGKSVITQSSTDTPVLGPDILHPNGMIVDVQQALKTDTFCISATAGMTNVPGLSVSITPKFAGNKVLIMCNIWASSNYYVGHVGLFQDETEIGLADAAGTRPRSFLDFAGNYTDQNSHGAILCLTGQLLIPVNSTDSRTYKIKIARRYDNQGQNSEVCINRSIPDREAGWNGNTTTYDHRKVSTVTVMEISGGVIDPNPVAKRTWQTKTNSESGYTAVSGDRLFVDTSGGTVTVTLPSSPAVGAFVRFVDVAGTFATNNLTIGRNSEKIMRSATDMTVSDSFSAFELVYSGSTHGWMITEI